MITINNINNIPLHYARLANHPYGTRGIQRGFRIESSFFRKLEIALTDLFEQCPLGKPEVITTAGVFVDKPGQHGRGKAFDLDAIFWKESSLVTLNFNHQKILYLGIESILRKHFGLVLNYFYPNHKDHWHIDHSVPVDFNTDMTSETFYVQLVLKHIYNKEVLVDGLWGRQTRGFVNEVFERLNINTPITTIVNYKKFLDLTAKIAFELYQPQLTPLDLLHNLVDVIDDLPFEHRGMINQALNSFQLHDESAIWLSSFDIDSDGNLENIIDSVLA